MTSDQNKYITNISYNHLNLPLVIQVAGKGSVQYWYDAAGNKLQKQVVDATITPNKVTNTLYLYGVYENDVLQFFPQEEGRIRPLRDANGNITGFTYDYFIKDNLGNVRMILTEQQVQDNYPAATLEGDINTNSYPNAV